MAAERCGCADAPETFGSRSIRFHHLRTESVAGFTPSLARTGATIPSLSCNSPASRCSGSISGLPCCPAQLVCLLDRFLRLDCEFVPTDCHNVLLKLFSSRLVSLLAYVSSVLYLSSFRCSRVCRYCSLKKKTGDEPPFPSRRLFEHWPSPCRLPLEGLLADSNFDLPWLGFRPLGQSDLQNALFIAGFHLFRVHRVGQLESADEGTIPALNAMEILFFLLLLKLALALNVRVLFSTLTFRSSSFTPGTSSLRIRFCSSSYTSTGGTKLPEVNWSLPVGSVKVSKKLASSRKGRFG